MNEIQIVKLNDHEQALYDAVCWDLDQLAKKDDRLAHFEKMGQLAESLLERDAIPNIRVAYFTDPAMNIGGNGKSRQDLFEKNGTSGKAIFRHAHFMAHLRYFLFGPYLPKDSIAGFCEIIDDDAGTSGMLLKQIEAYVRKQVRDKGLSRSHAAEEFFKLAHEIKAGSFIAECVRSAAMSVRK
jgi:hypothetical protein